MNERNQISATHFKINLLHSSNHYLCTSNCIRQRVVVFQLNPKFLANKRQITSFKPQNFPGKAEAAKKTKPGSPQSKSFATRMKYSAIKGCVVRSQELNIVKIGAELLPYKRKTPTVLNISPTNPMERRVGKTFIGRPYLSSYSIHNHQFFHPSNSQGACTLRVLIGCFKVNGSETSILCFMKNLFPIHQFVFSKYFLFLELNYPYSTFKPFNLRSQKR